MFADPDFRGLKTMKSNYRNLSSPTASLILQAQRELLLPDRFYRLCQAVRQSQKLNRLYFLSPEPELLGLNQSVDIYTLQVFFDRLARYVRQSTQVGCKTVFYLQKASMRSHKQICKRLAARRNKPFRLTRKSTPGAIAIEVEIAGAGMVGRVARVRVNDGRDLAFKAFLDRHFVWQHGPWAEIPAGIYLHAHAVTKDLPEFLFAGQDWAVWEWVYPHTSPQARAGISYEEFAKQVGLTQLNGLNRDNYNPHNMRLDFGGIQPEYRGRRVHAFLRGLIFYGRKIRREGLSSLKTYLTINQTLYLASRLRALLFSSMFQKRAWVKKDLRQNRVS